MPLVGHQHQIDILELTDKGDGKGRLFDRPLFVEGLLPGEQALVELTEVKPNYLHGKVTELLQRVLGKNPATTVVNIDEVDFENWGIGGLPVLDYRAAQAAVPGLQLVDPERRTGQRDRRAVFQRSALPVLARGDGPH